MKRLFIPVFLSFILMTGCKSGHYLELEPEAYLNWYSSEKNQFKSTDTINDVCYTIAFYPKEIAIAMCAVNKCEQKEVLLTDLKQKSSTESYLLEFTSLDPRKDLFEIGLNNMSMHDQMIYLNNGIKNELKGVSQKGDTLSCISVIYEPLLSNKFRLIADFERPLSGMIDQILYKDQLMSSSQIKFDFSKNSQSDFPLLNLKNYEK